MVLRTSCSSWCEPSLKAHAVGADTRVVRSVLIVTILTALAVGLAGCGGSSDLGEASTTPVTTESTPPDATVEVTGGEISAKCREYGQAYGDLSLNLQIASQLTTDEQYAQLSANGGPVNLDVDALERSVETLGGLPGVEAQLLRMREITALLRSNVESGAPFGDGSGDGQRLVDLLGSSFVDDVVAITIALQEGGCGAA